MQDLLLYFTAHEDEEVQIKAIMGLGKAASHLHQRLILIILDILKESVYTLFIRLLKISPGFQFIMHPELMFVQDVKVLYNNTLLAENSQVNRKIQVLKNLQTYLQEEDSRMQEADRECESSESNLSSVKEHGGYLMGHANCVCMYFFFLIQGKSKPSKRISKKWVTSRPA